MHRLTNRRSPHRSSCSKALPAFALVCLGSATVSAQESIRPSGIDETTLSNVQRFACPVGNAIFARGGNASDSREDPRQICTEAPAFAPAERRYEGSGAENGGRFGNGDQFQGAAANI